MLRNSLQRVVTLGLIVLISVPQCSASWFSDITGIDINIPAGTISFGPPRPDRIPMMLQNLPKDAAQFFLNPLGSPLAFAIRNAKANVRRAGCGPASPDVINALTPFIPPSVFEGVCWTSLRPGLSLDTFVIQDGGMSAVTLEDTIVFKDTQSGFDPVLWAHELMHVLQYRRLGVEGFATLYSVSWRSMEDEAYAFQNFVSSRLNINQGSQGWQSQYYSASYNWDPNAGISDQEYVQWARHAINPLSCSGMQRGDNSIQVYNNCPIAFRVVDFTLGVNP